MHKNPSRRVALSIFVGVVSAVAVVLGPTIVRYVESRGLPPDYFDLQASLAFSNSTTALIFNVVATEQSSDCAYGAAYLLNGYTSAHYWYQVGLSWNWRTSSPGRFAMNYNVFNPSGTVVDPSSGSGGSVPFDEPVSAGNVIHLILAPTNDSILMTAIDLTTGSTASTSFSSFGYKSFDRGIISFGSGAFFTGLMTECYRGSSGQASWENVTYFDADSATPFANFCVGEWNFSNGSYFTGGTPVFPESCSPVLDLSKSGPNVFSDHGVMLWANETEFSSTSQ